MADTKNRAVLYHQGRSFVIYQDDKDKWIYTYGNLLDVNTQSKDLQTALNLVYETINESVPPSSKDNMRAGGLKITKRGRDHKQPRKARVRKDKKAK
jgi:hypothetical protein